MQTFHNDPALEAVENALLLADKLMQEPSEGVVVSGMDASLLGRPSVDDDSYVLSIWGEMRDQLLREVGE